LRAMEPTNTVLLPTTVVGSYSVPERLKRLKTEYYQRRISAQHMAEIHEVAIKAAVKDQELAGIDNGSDGELRRANDVDYSRARAPGRRGSPGAGELAAGGAGLLQVDEPFLAGYPEQVELAIEAVNIVTEDVPVSWALHVCYGNRYARPSWEGHYDFLFPAVKAARVDQVVLEFARKGLDDLRLIRQHGWDKWLGLGVIDVKNPEVEAAELVASRIRRALEYVPADRLMINPDCGLRHLAPDVARQKLRAMVAGVALVRAELPEGQTS